MADRAVWQRTIVDERGNIIPGAEVTVRSYPGGSLVTLYESPEGAPKSNPFVTGHDGFARFWADSQRVEIVAVGAGSSIRWIVDLLNADEVIGDAISEATAAAAVAVGEAEAAADRAEAARDAAQLNAGVYEDTAAGLAATTDGDYFSVPSDDSDEYLILYRNDSGSATEIRRYPSAEAVESEVTDRSRLIDDFANAEVPGVGAVSAYAATEQGVVAEATRANDGRKFVLGRAGALGVVPTEADVKVETDAIREMIDEQEVAIIPGVDPLSAYSAARDGVVVEGTRASDGRKLAIGQRGRLAPVPTEDDLTGRRVAAQASPGVPASIEVAEVAENDEGRVAGVRTTQNHRWSSRGGRMIPDDAPYYDVVVYGAGLAALTAARAAFEQGMTVCLITEDDRLGGMMSGGISVLDTYEWTGITTDWMQIIGGYTRQFVAEINAHHLHFANPRRFQARAAQAVANRWGAEYAHRVILNSPIHDRWHSLVMDRQRIAGVMTAEGMVRCAQAIDASYTGDLVRATTTWTATREAAGTNGEDDAGFNFAGASTILSGVNVLAAAQAMGYTEVPQEAYDLNTILRVEDLGDLPPDGSATETQMAFNCRSEITDAPDRIPFAARPPSNYDRRRYILAFAEALANGATEIWDTIHPQDGLQATLPLVAGQSSVSIYNTNSGLIGHWRTPEDYATARWSRRREIARDVVEQHMGMFYFLATDEAVASELPALQSSVQQWGWDPREWVDSPYGDGIPHKAYERQTIRLVTDAIVTKPFMKIANGDPGSSDRGIGLFNYPLDTKQHTFIAHDPGGDGTNVTVYGEGFTSGAAVEIYSIPIDICIPRRSDVSNLTVAWCVATTDLAWRSLRMEPSGGMMGEAMGVVAALAHRHGLAVQDVPYAEVRRALIENRGVLSI